MPTEKRLRATVSGAATPTKRAAPGESQRVSASTQVRGPPGGSHSLARAGATASTAVSPSTAARVRIGAARYYARAALVIDPDRPLVLGSASPRRRTILAGLGIPLRVVAADISETLVPGEGPSEYQARIVLEKLAAVAARLGAEPCAGVLVADTVVVLGDAILGKPRDVEEAARLLGRLVGRAHTVFTRYAIALAGSAAEVAIVRTVESQVFLRAAARDEIARYAATGEGLDKAGAYAAQGIGSFLVERIEGSYTNVVGLPACEVVLDLQAVGLLARFP